MADIIRSEFPNEINDSKSLLLAARSRFVVGDGIVEAAKLLVA